MDEPDIDTLGIKALKELITGAGLSTEDCIDKADLRARAREALQAKKASPAASAAPAVPSASAKPGERQLGGYPCKIELLNCDDLLTAEAGPPADLLLIVLHGLGATNSDFVHIPAAFSGLDARFGASRIVSVFPQAP